MENKNYLHAIIYIIWQDWRCSVKICEVDIVLLYLNKVGDYDFGDLHLGGQQS